MKVTYYGHACFSVVVGGKELELDWLCAGELRDLSHLNRQYEHRPAILIKSPLQFKDGVIVQPACQHVFVLEHQLPGKKLRLRKAFGDVFTKFGRLIRNVRAEGKMRFGVKPLVSHVSGITFHFAPRVFAPPYLISSYISPT